MPRCLKCDKPNREGARFCEECGARLTAKTAIVSIAPGADGGALPCPVCSLQNAPHMNFCRRCGGKLPKSAPKPQTVGFPAFAATAAPGGPPATGSDGPRPQVAVLMPPAAPAPSPAGPVGAPKQPCPSCGGLTPLGFAFCQLCGQRMSEPGAAPARESHAAPAPAAPAASHRSPVPAASRPTPIGIPATAPAAMPAMASGQLSAIRLVAIQRDGADGDVHQFAAEKLGLGRREGEIVFANDPYLADLHARIERRDRQWVLVDLGSRNGTFVRARDPTVLRPQEVLLLGKQVLALDLLPVEQTDAQPAAEHGVLVFGTPVRPAWARLRQLTMSGVARDVYYLCRPEVTLGREDGDILFPEDEFMSRCHLVLQHRDGTVTLIDQGSSNGTYLRVRGEREIVGGDHIRLGDQLLRFEVA